MLLEDSVKSDLNHKVGKVLNDCGNRGILNSSVTSLHICKVIDEIKDSHEKNFQSKKDLENIICEFINNFRTHDVLNSQVVEGVIRHVRNIFNG